MKFWRWLVPGEHEGVERARLADQRAGEELRRAKQNGRHALKLLRENSLTERFIGEMHRRGSI